MSRSEELHNHRQDDEEFVPERVDEQIEALLLAPATEQAEQPQPAGARLMRDLAALKREDASSLESIWQRLSAHDTSNIINPHTREAEELRGNRSYSGTLSSIASRKRPIQRRPGIIAAVACIVLLVGSLALVLNIARIAGTNGGIQGQANGLCTPNGKDTTAPAPVTFTERAGQSGLYVVGGQGIYRFDAQGDKLQPLWLFKMNACTALTPTIYPGLHYGGITPLPSITTGAAVANNMAFFGVNEQSGGYLYALHTIDGSLAWKTKVEVSGTPLVLDNLVVIETGDSAGNPVIMALDARNGSVRWSHRYASSITNQSEVLGDVGGHRVYASTSNTIFALDITSGQQVWSTDIESGQIISGTRYFDGTVYVTASSTCFNCEVLPGTSAAYAFNPASGKQLWESQKVAGYLSPPTEAQGVVYFGSIDGYVHALRASNGKQLWQVYADGEVRAAPIVANGVVYIEAGRFLDPTKQGTENGQIDAIDTAGKALASFSPFGLTGIELGGSTTSSIRVGGGVMYVSGASNFLYLFRASNYSLLLRHPISAIHSGNLNELTPTMTLVL